MKKKHKVLLSFVLLLSGIALAWLAFHGLIWAYCSDAYMRANIATISPRIDGYLLNVNISNNQAVKKGQELMLIDPYPYELKRDVQKAAVQQQEIQLKIITSQWENAVKVENAMKISYDLALTNYNRYKKLLSEDATSPELMEKVKNTLETTEKSWDDARENVRIQQQSMEAQKALIASSQAELALAEYYLTQTRICASSDGYITNINCRPGDYVKPGDKLFGLVDDSHWWVEADYKEYLLHYITPGKKVWIIADVYPFRVYEGEVENISRGTLRDSDTPGILPTVSPTTDWVRLAQRFQVRIRIKTPAGGKDKFYMGSDVRTLIVL